MPGQKQTRKGYNSVDAREDAFARAFVLGITKGNPRASAVEAGFAEASARNQAFRLLSRPSVIAKIAKYEAEREIRREKAAATARDKFIELYELAKAAGDLSNANRSAENQAKIDGEPGFNGRVDLVLSEAKTKDALRKALTVVAQMTTADQFEAITARLEALDDE